jgi:hypothetical protein
MKLFVIQLTSVLKIHEMKMSEDPLYGQLPALSASPYDVMKVDRCIVTRKMLIGVGGGLVIMLVAKTERTWNDDTSYVT